jgi:simple sugar transport system ATP-binding protein
MKNDGYSVIFVSHKLTEVLSIADRITVLRRGRLVETMSNRNVRKQELANLMVGRDVVFDMGQRGGEGPQAATSANARTVLKMQNVTARNDRHLVALDNVSLILNPGEIMGIAGVAGNGQLELAEVITGLRKVELGAIYTLGKNVTNRSVREIIELGVAYIPEDRINVGSIGTLGITDNVLLKCYDLFSFFDMSEISNCSKALMDKYDVVYSDISAPVKYLSGGNLQKLILSRELREMPKLLVAAYPTRGLDVGAIEYVRNVLLACRESGSAILLISEDLDELLTMSDRIEVMYEGRLTSMPTKDIHRIGLAMAGLHKE